jgi:hypothetical protein
MANVLRIHGCQYGTLVAMHGSLSMSGQWWWSLQVH